MPEPRVIRLPVRKYVKSGRLIAVKGYRGREGVAVLEFSPDLTRLIALRTQSSVRGDLHKTRYVAELEEKEWDTDGQPMFSFRLLRTLLPEDLSLSRWTSTAALDDLPVSPHPELTEEERAWTGERSGNLIACGFLTVFVMGCLAMSAAALYLASVGGLLWWGLPTFIAGYCLLTHEWRVARAADPEKLSELHDHKARLRDLAETGRRLVKSEFDRRLLAFETWAALTPQHFEVAITRLLEREGFRQPRTTQYSRDGGVDVTAIDPSGRATIVQAKQYAGKVGVAPVRELAGVRQLRGEDARAILFSLEGFSREAISAAGKLRVELRDIRSMLQQVSKRPVFADANADDASVEGATYEG